MDDEQIEQVVCKVNDLQNNEMKTFDFGQNWKVLVAKENDNFFAVGTKCSHYGAPLVKGVVYNGHVRCPWHGACFSLSSGDIEDFPGYDSLPKYKVEIKGDDVKVVAMKSDLIKNLRTKSMCKRDPKNEEIFVIIGGGAAGFQCAEVLRQQGFSGRLVLISQEDSLPYDRTKLSKALSSKAESLAIRSKDFFDKFDIEIILNRTATSLNTKAKVLTLDNGSSIKYTKIFLASGASPRKLNIKGCELKEILYLRTHVEANLIAEKGKDKNVVIVGTSFIGMEVAAFLADKAKCVTVVGKSSVPFSFLGETFGRQIQTLFESKNVKIINNCNALEFKGKGKLEEVVLDDNTKIKADICVVGIGVIPNASYLINSGVKLDENGYVLVNNNFKTNLNDVYAGGDLVRFPFLEHDFVNIGHWQVAQTHGKYAALSMLGKTSNLKMVPFFWSMFFGKGLRFSGYLQGFDDIYVDGEISEYKFIIYYLKNDRVKAVATMNNDPVASMFASLSKEGKELKSSDIKDDKESWMQKFTS